MHKWRGGAARVELLGWKLLSNFSMLSGLENVYRDQWDWMWSFKGKKGNFMANKMFKEDTLFLLRREIVIIVVQK